MNSKNTKNIKTPGESEKSEQSLLESHVMFSLAMQSSRMGAWEHDIATGIINWSDELEEIFGLKKGSFGGTREDYYALIHEDDRERIWGEVQNALEEKRTYSIEFRFHHADGSIRWMEGRGEAVYSEKGVPVRVYGIGIDITERKQAEKEILKLGALNHEILESITDGFFALDRNWRFTYVNSQAELILDRKPGDLIGKIIWEEYPGLAGSEFEKAYLRTANEGVVSTLTSFYPDHERWYEVNAYPAPNGITVYFRNVTERVKTQKAVLETQAETERQRRLYDTILSNSPDLAYVFDLDHRFTFANEVLLQMWGKTAEEALGKTCLELGYEPWHAAMHDREIDQVIATKQPIRGEVPFDGTFGRRVYDYIFVPIFGANGEVEAVAGTTRDITDRQLMEQTLRESEKRFRIMADHAPVMIWVTEADATCTYLSQSWYDFTGQTPETGLGFGWIDATHPDDQKLAHDVFIAANEKHEAFRVEYRLRRKDGNYLWAIDSAQPRFSDTGDFLGYIGSVIDITERKQAEEKIKESEERYRTLFNSIDEGFCIIEVLFDSNDKPFDYRFIQANPAMERLTGLENAIGKTARELVPDLEDFWFETYGKVVLTGEAIRFESSSEPLNRWFDVYALRLGDSDSRRVAVVFNDITERKLTEKNLRESELRFRGLQQATPDGFMIFEAVRDENHKIIDFKWLYVNPAAEKIIGRRGFEIVGKNLLEIMPENRNEGLFDAYVSVVETGELWQEEFRYFHDNLDHFFLSTAVRVSDGFAVAFSDITERKRIELEREQLFELEKSARIEAEAANRAKDEFLSVLSHELRTPLNAILGWTRMMQMGMLDEERQKQAIETIERNARLQNNLIEDLLDVSRIISGKILIEEEEADFVSIVKSSIETVQTLADGKKVKLEFNSSVKTLKIIGDPTRLQQIIVNLTNNAIKFTPENGDVKLDLTHTADFLTLKISDTGIGISADFLPHIFDRFRQADSTTRRNHSGLGLGLTIVSHLTELHSGRVSAASDGAGKGAIFTLEIPLNLKTPTASTELEQSETLPDETPEKSPLQNKSILLVDDDCEGIFPVQIFLEQHGAEVHCADTAREALEKLDEQIFDVIISDIGMPEVDGYNLITRIRATEKNKAIPAIALTAYASAEDREHSLSSGFQHHLPKPVDFDNLLQTITNILNETNRK